MCLYFRIEVIFINYKIFFLSLYIMNVQKVGENSVEYDPDFCSRSIIQDKMPTLIFNVEEVLEHLRRYGNRGDTWFSC